MYPKNLILEYIKKEQPERYTELIKTKITNPKEFNQKCEIISYEMREIDLSNTQIDDTIEIEDLHVDTKRDGIRYIDGHYEHRILKNLSTKALNKNQSLNVFISNSFVAKGKFINEIKQYRQEVKLAFIGERTHPTGEKTQQVYFLDDKPDKRRLQIIRELIVPLWIYQFDSENQQFIVLSEERIELETYTIEGTLIRLGDEFQIGQSKSLKINLPVVFLNKLHRVQQRFNNKEDMINKCKKVALNHKNYFNWLFSQKGKTYNHPKYFQYLISSILLSHSHTYPLHLMIIAKPGSGKSTIEECIYEKYTENIGIIEGSCSTMKALIPSFKGNLPDPGALIKSNKICVIDEFLRILMRTHKDDREEQLAALNPLLEHKKRNVKSGNGEININPTMQCISVTNPIWGTKTMHQLCERLDNSHLSRWFIWYQDKEHIHYVQEEKGLEDNYYTLDKDFWEAIINFMHSFKCDYDNEKVKEIFSLGLELIGDDTEENVLQRVRDVYSARYKHHIGVLMDGIIKTRCLCTYDPGFVAVEKDYEILKVLWLRMLFGWDLQLNDIDKTGLNINIYI